MIENIDAKFELEIAEMLNNLVFLEQKAKAQSSPQLRAEKNHQMKI